MSESMRDRILEVAKAEFLEKGYDKASMRSIAGKLGITAAALYWHFENKEALFDALVGPVVSVIHDYAVNKEAADYRELAEQTATSGTPNAEAGKPELNTIWDSRFYTYLLNLAYQHKEAAELLIRCAGGTKYETVLDDLVKAATDATYRYLQEARASGIPAADVDKNHLHILMSTYYNSMLEPIRQGYEREAAEAFLKSHETFFVAGWRTYLNL